VSSPSTHLEQVFDLERLFVHTGGVARLDLFSDSDRGSDVQADPAASRPAATASLLTAPVQRSFADLGAPLFDVTFCVIDLETTGGSPETCGITEIGAVKLRAGECLGRFQTLVNPGVAIPPTITVLTGITQSMVLPAPRIESVLPSLLEFIGDAVIVGHNVRFDLGFLRHALDRAGHPPLRNRNVDTYALAKRLVRDEVRNLKLGTLAQHFRLPNEPNHRALDDALATGDLLHVMLERAAALGVTGLDDLLALPKIGGHPQVAKLDLTVSLPRRPGVYLFKDRAGRVLYVGKASNLRTRVRSYFSSDTRRKVGSLLREVHHIDHEICHHPLEAAVREVRLIHEHQPRYNRQARDWSRYVYLRLTTNEAFPRLSVVRTVKNDGSFHLGPLPSTRMAKQVAEAIESVVPLRRCTARPGKQERSAPCTSAQLGVSTCPCSGDVSAEDYRALVELTLRALREDPRLLLEPLAARMDDLAAQDRFEEAADVRDRAASLADALRRQRRMDALHRCGRLVIVTDGHGGAEFRHGALVNAWSAEPADATGPRGKAQQSEVLPFAEPASGAPLADGDQVEPGTPVPRHLADELACIAAWLEQRADTTRVEHCDEGLSFPVLPLRSFMPRRPAA
jgi:DNA polymerase III subunit epsilon